MGRRGAHTVNDKQLASCRLSGCPSEGYSLTAPSWNLNVNSRACCFARNVGDPVTDADVDAAARWAAAGKLTGMVDKAARWHGHRCVAWKDCPGDRVWARLDDLADLTADYVKRGDLSMSANGPEHWDAADWAAFNNHSLGKITLPTKTDGTQEDVSVAEALRAARWVYWRLTETGVKQVDEGLMKHLLGADVVRNVSVTDPASPGYMMTTATVLSDLENTQDEQGRTLGEILTALASTPPGSTVVTGLTNEALAAIAKAVNDEEARRQQA
jgi:hypothetical protein